MSAELGWPAGLSLADGTRWSITGKGRRACASVLRLAQAMQLRPAKDPTRQLQVLVDGDRAEPRARLGAGDARVGRVREEVLRGSIGSLPGLVTVLPSEDEHTILCRLSHQLDGEALAVQLMQLSFIISQDVHSRGGLLLHGALAVHDGRGAILAGPGGTGKTSCSRRLPTPWRSLSDDSTLVVRDSAGTYWAHPWPTWSRFMFGGAGGTWKVEEAVRLSHLFFLQQALDDRAEALGECEAAILISHSAEQVGSTILTGMVEEEVRRLRLQRFENGSRLARSVPAHMLQTSQAGAFWTEMESAMAESSFAGA